MKLLQLLPVRVAVSLVLLCFQMNGKGIEIEDGIVGYWPFDGHAADVIYDNHGRVIGSVSYIDGILGKAVYLDGENSIIQIGDEEIGLPNALPPIHAASFWVRVEEKSGYIIYTPDDWYAKYLEPGYLLGAGHQVPKTLAWANGEESRWHHVVVQTWYDQVPPLYPIGEMYVDGELIPPAGLPPNNRTALLGRFPSFFYIGGDRIDPGFRGTLDELAVWNRALSLDEVKQIFQLGMEGRSLSGIFRDIDEDGLPDIWEIEEGLDETIDGTIDLDKDGLDNATEWKRGLNPWLSDTDGDGLLDSVETETTLFESEEDTGTNPRLNDSDGDGISDNDEISLGTNPNGWDSDHDGFGDGDELQAQSDPLDLQKKPNIGFGLKAYWSFDDDLKDLQGRYEGVMRPDGVDAEFAPGVLSDGVKLNGEALIEVPTDQDDFAFANQSFTMACWVKIENWTRRQWPQYLLSHQEGRQWHVAAGMNPFEDELRGWYFQVEASGQALHQPKTDGYIVSWNTHSQNWQHIACVYISPKGDYTGVFRAKPQVYLNGIRRKWQSNGRHYDELTPFGLREQRGVSDKWDGLTIGGVGHLEGTLSLNGMIDDLAIWSRAVTDSEIFAIYNASVNAGSSIKHLIGADSDSDGMPDSWETENGLLPRVDDSTEDPDNDGLTNKEEFDRGTSPHLADTDQDGFSDLVETNTGRWVDEEGTGSNPLKSDSDGDGLLDGMENPATGGSNPNQVDSDSDGLDDRTERLFRSDAASSESIPRLEQGLVAYWPFENGLEDRVGVHNGTFHGGRMSFSRGQFGEAIRFDGVDDAIEVTGGREEDFDFIEQSFSVSLWFHADKHPLLKNPGEQVTDYGLLSKGRAQEIGLNASMSYGRISYSGTQTLENIPIGDGIMHHFVGIVDVTRRRTDVYLDGRLISTGIPKIGDLSYRLWFGTHPEKIERPEINRENELYYWAGLIDDVAIWKRPLAYSEIKALYESGESVSGLARLDLIEPEPVDPEPVDENRDRDGDGVSDVLEKIAGTNPEEAAEYFRIMSIDRVGEGLELTWTSVIGKDYILEYTRDLKIAAWEAVGEAVSATEGTRETRTIDSNPERIGAPSGYYRVRVVNLP